MEAPGITRRRRPRRPFLAPLWLTALLVLAVASLVFLALLALRLESPTVVVLVHPPLEGRPLPGDDPPLSAQGQQQAQRLAIMFGDPGVTGHLDALYVSDTRSARDTLAPLAERLRQQPVVVSTDPARTVSRVMREHAGGTVLVVASGDRMPELVRRLSGTRLPPGQDDAGYIVGIPTFGRASLLRFRY
jgi:hypothetical protein